MPRPGEKATDFTLPSFIDGGKKEPFTLSSHLGKFVLIIFSPVDFGYVTPTEFYDLEELLPEFEKYDCEIVAISTEQISRYFLIDCLNFFSHFCKKIPYIQLYIYNLQMKSTPS